MKKRRKKEKKKKEVCGNKQKLGRERLPSDGQSHEQHIHKYSRSVAYPETVRVATDTSNEDQKETK